MEYLIHHVKFEMCPSLHKFSILLSTVKLYIRHKFSQFIYVQIWGFRILNLGFTFKFFPIYKEIKNWVFWMLLNLQFLIFPNSWMKEIEIEILEYWLDYTSKFSSIR